MELGHEVSLLDRERYQDFVRKQAKCAQLLEYIENVTVNPNSSVAAVLEKAGSSIPRKSLTLGDLMRRPETNHELAADVDDLLDGRFRCMWAGLNDEARRYVMAEITYKEYIEREARQVATLRAADRVRIPSDFSYQEVKHITAEVLQRLDEVRPRTLGQACRISGVTPAAITMLEIHLRRNKEEPENNPVARK